MSSSSLKILASVLVAIGVGLCATFGAQLTPKTLQVVTYKLADSKEAVPLEVEAPLDRVQQWWSISSLPFCGGLCLILLGSGLARSAQSSVMKKLSTTESSQDSIDLSSSLEQIINEVKTLQNLVNTEHSTE